MKNFFSKTADHLSLDNQNEPRIRTKLDAKPFCRANVNRVFLKTRTRKTDVDVTRRFNGNKKF